MYTIVFCLVGFGVTKIANFTCHKLQFLLLFTDWYVVHSKMWLWVINVGPFSALACREPFNGFRYKYAKRRGTHMKNAKSMTCLKVYLLFTSKYTDAVQSCGNNSNDVTKEQGKKLAKSLKSKSSLSTPGWIKGTCALSIFQSVTHAKGPFTLFNNTAVMKIISLLNSFS